MKRILSVLFLITLGISGCEISSQNTSLPSTRPADLVIEYRDGIEGKDFYLSADSSFAVFTVNDRSKKINFNLTAGEMDVLFKALQMNTFARIDTIKLPIENLSEDAKKPIYIVKVTWGGNKIEKYTSADTHIKDEWKEKYDIIVAAIQEMTYSGIEKTRRDFVLEIDESMRPDNSFMTVDLNTYFSGDSLYFYNSNDMGEKDALNVRVVDGKNLLNLFMNVKNPTPGQKFVIAEGAFEIDITGDMKGLRLYLEGDSLKYTPIK
jgi:hypothetical protein